MAQSVAAQGAPTFTRDIAPIVFRECVTCHYPGGTAPFSSQGLSFDWRVRPDLVGPGVALMTSEPSAAADGTSAYGTVNGSSAEKTASSSTSRDTPSLGVKESV